MTFATEILIPDSDRFALVKISAKKLLTGGIFISGNDYQFTVPSGMIISDIVISPVDDSPTYVYSGTTLTVTSTYDLTSSSNYAVLYHSIYVTGDTTRYTSGISGVDDAEWLPILETYPYSTQSMRNIAEGVFSLSSSQLSLLTTDRLIQTYLGTNDSFCDSDVKVWICVNSASNHKVAFEGKISSVDVSNGKSTFEVQDSFLKLTQSALFGSQGVHAIGGIAENPGPDVLGTAIPMTLGYSSPFVLSPGFSPANTISISSYEHYHVTKGLNLILDTPATYGNGTTVSFFVGKYIGTTLKKLTFGTITRAYRSYIYANVYPYTTYVYQNIYWIQCSNFSGEVGDYIPPLAAWIINARAHVGPDGQTYQFSCSTQYNAWSSPGAPGIDGTIANPTLVDNTYSSYCVYRTNVAQPSYDDQSGSSAHSDDFIYYINGLGGTVTPVHTSLGTIGGQTVTAFYISINFSTLCDATTKFIFQNNMHKNLYCRFSPATSVSHATAIDFIIKSSGLSVNSSSITTADSDLSADVSVTFPLGNDTTLASYLSCAQYMCQSAFGLLRLNSSREVVYEVIKNPDGMTTDYTRTDTDILIESFGAKTQYQDTYAQVLFNNPQMIDQDSAIDTGPRATVENRKAQYLHTITRVKKYDHGLKSIQNRKAGIAGYLGNATVEYSSSTSSNDLDTNIGDVVSLTNVSVLGSSETVKALVVEVINSPSESTLKLNEIRGVP